MVAEYWTTLPPKAEFEQKIQTILAETRERMAQRNLLMVDDVEMEDSDGKVSLAAEDLKTQYLHNPCETLATAFWKEHHFPKPKGISIALDKKQGNDKSFNKGVRYFRLIHHLDVHQEAILPDGYTFKEILLPNDAELVADVINKCYEGYSQTKENILRWRSYPVFDNSLWLFIWDSATNLPVALGIADFDSDIKEGSMEWIQVMPQHRGMGFGKAIVLELLSRLEGRADFVTVSGEVENATNPEQLYRKCGFVGDAVWVVVRY
jgi:ribosomal protein S18 acetylase RimI-like enzyme